MLDNDQEGVSGSNQWAPYSLGRRDVPPDNMLKKVRSVNISVKHLISVFNAEHLLGDKDNYLCNYS